MEQKDKMVNSLQVMQNGETRDRYKSAEDGTGYIRTKASEKGGWQQAHFHEHLRETYIIQNGWVACAQLIENRQCFTVHHAGQIFTIRPKIIHNIFLPANAKIHTVKHGKSPCSDDKINNKSTKSFTVNTCFMTEEDIKKQATPATSCVIAVERDRKQIVPWAVALRAHAHRQRLPHTSVLIAPVRIGKSDLIEVLVHRRPNDKDVSPNTWDTFGGHVEISIPNADIVPSHGKFMDQVLFKSLIDDTAVLEAIEEIRIPHFDWEQRHLHRFGDYGSFECGFDDSCATNVEFSTLYLAAIPGNTKIKVCESSDNSNAQFSGLRHHFVPIDKLLKNYKKDPDQFADGIGRILRRLEDRKTRNRFNEFVVHLKLKMAMIADSM